MKILIFIFLAISQMALAQYTNTFFLGGGIGYNDNKDVDDFSAERVSTFTASPNIGFFLNNNLAIGAGYEHSYQKTTYTYTSPNSREIYTNYEQGFSIFARHYWFFEPKFGLIATLQGNFLFGASFDETNTKTQTNTYRNRNVSLMPGIVFFLTRRLGVELNVNLLNYSYYVQKSNANDKDIKEGFSLIGNSSLPLGQIGFRYYLLKK
ncbi:MAG: hypothetical protein SFU27_13660 [Thermonemataceae bacterium]|nr:hypothetical protein [Thermonemataceae bacterium]